MKHSRNLLFTALLAALSTPALAEVTIDVIGGSEVSFEGLVQADGNWFDNDIADLNGNGANGKDSEFELRRAELVVKGKGPGMLSWVVGYDAKADKFLDTNVAWKFNGATTLTVGQYKQPNSMEELSSTKNNDFISKATATNTFAVARRLGVQLGTTGDNWGLAGSVFSRELTDGAHGPGYGVRGYFTPVNADGQLLHLGLSYVDLDTDADTLRLRARPQADLATVRLVDTGSLTNTDRQSTLGAEMAWVNGPVKVQGEYFTSNIDRYGTGSDFTGDAWYLSGLWNVTGETWGYKNGVITTSRADSPASGMWQLGLRYDAINLDDGSVLGGEMNSITAGVNWYWRSHFKFSMNYVMVESDRRGIQDDPNILEARASFFW